MKQVNDRTKAAVAVALVVGAFIAGAEIDHASRPAMPPATTQTASSAVGLPPHDLTSVYVPIGVATVAIPAGYGAALVTVNVDANLQNSGPTAATPNLKLIVADGGGGHLGHPVFGNVPAASVGAFSDSMSLRLEHPQGRKLTVTLYGLAYGSTSAKVGSGSIDVSVVFTR